MVSNFENPATEEVRTQREKMILEHMGQVRLLAIRLHKQVFRLASLDDLISAGTLGLISAVDRYNPRLDVSLRTYAEFRIHGAMMDSLRKMDWAPRARRRNARDIEAATRSAQQKLQAIPDEEHVAAEMGETVEAYRTCFSRMQGMDRKLFWRGPASLNPTTVSRLAAPKEKSPASLYERSELKRLLAEAMRRIPVRERTVLSLFYDREFAGGQVAEQMGVHVSRVYQIRASAIQRLRSKIQPRWPKVSHPVL